MKAIVYHADAPLIAGRYPENTYKKLLEGLKINCNSFRIPLIHITIEGFQGYGDENIFVKGDPDDIIWNREKFFIDYLQRYADPDEVYYFTEPDSRINRMFPLLTTDLSMLYRKRVPKITPAWRLAKKSALPIFEEAFSYYNSNAKHWDTDIGAWNKIYQKMGEPQIGITNYKNLSVELRNYKEYCLERVTGYVSQYKSNNKLRCISRDSLSS
jgi:hypothetical protein